MRRPGFVDGTRALFSGFGFVLGTPDVWPLAIVPVAAGVLATAAVAGGALHFVMPVIAGLFSPRWHLLTSLLEIVVGALTLVLAALLGFGIAQPLSGPALNRIVRRVEADLGAPAWPSSSMVEDVGRAFQSIAVSYAIGLPLLALLFLVSFFVPAAAVVTFPLKLVVLGLSIAWDLCDYPLSIHGVPIGKRVGFVARNLGAMVGFSFALGVLSLVPCALVLVLPAGVAGAARLTRRIELFEANAPR
jgi:CysZ protein